MHPWRPLLALIAFAPLAAPAAVVYKWTDADGVVHYSDQPEPGAERVPIGPAPLQGNSKAIAPQPKKAPEKPKPPKPVRLGYTDIAIVVPAQEKTFTDEAVPVLLNLTPGLQPEHTLTWYLNGTPLEYTTESFSIPHLDRGTYTIYASITDPATQETANSDPVTFYVRQTSVLAPLYPKK
jgi:hypothetical protein